MKMKGLLSVWEGGLLCFVSEGKGRENNFIFRWSRGICCSFVIVTS